MRVELTGNYTVERGRELKETLQSALEGGKEMILSFGHVEGADLSFFQVLHGAVRAFGKRRVSLVLTPDFPRHLAFRARAAGFSAIVRAE